MKHLFRSSLVAAAVSAGLLLPTAAHALTTLYTKTLQNVYLDDQNPFGPDTETIDLFTISGQRFNLYLTFNLVNDFDFPGFNSLVTFQAVSANRLLDFQPAFTPYSVINSAGVVNAVWNNLPSGTYDLAVTFNGTVLGAGDANLNGTLTATTVPEPAVLALGAMAVLVGFGGRRMRSKAA